MIAVFSKHFMVNCCIFLVIYNYNLIRINYLDLFAFIQILIRINYYFDSCAKWP